MTVRARVLVETVQIPTAVSSQYTAPANTSSLIDKMTATNTSAAAVTLTVFLVPAGGSAGVASTVISAQSIAAGATYLCPEVAGHILNPGDSVSTSSSAVALTVRISGREVA